MTGPTWLPAEPIPARRHPDGWVVQRVAQRVPHEPDRPWVLTTVVDHHLHLELLTDDDVAGWPELT